jgi:type I restriction enzyme R subunit
VRYIDGTGKPMGSKEYLEMLVGKLPELYADENQLRELWSDPKTREDLLKELEKI